MLWFFLSHFLYLFLVLKQGSNIHNGFPVSKIKGKIDLIMNRAWRDLEKIRGAMPLTAGSTLFLPFKSGAKVSARAVADSCWPAAAFLSSYWLESHTSMLGQFQQDENTQPPPQPTQYRSIEGNTLNIAHAHDFVQSLLGAS